MRRQETRASTDLSSAIASFKQALQPSRLMHAVRGNLFAVPGVLIVCVYLLAVLFPRAFTARDPTRLNLRDKFLPPSQKHPFGTDSMGMDLYARIVYGARITLMNVCVVLIIAVSFGSAIGLTGGYAGGYIDEVFMRITDVFLAFPPLILALAINSALGRGMFQSMLAVGATWWPSYARLIRGQVLSVKREEYVIAAHAVGVPPLQVVFRHIAPNCSTPVIVRVTLDVGFVALTTAGLSFLGLGAEPPTPEWGRMVYEGSDYLMKQWWVTAFPGLALFLVVVGFNLLGDLVRDWLDPRSLIRGV